MGGPSTGAKRAGGLTLALWCTAVVVELATVGVACVWFDEVADASPFGRSGTIAIVAVGVLAALAGTVCAQRGVSGPSRVILGILVAFPAGLVALLTFAFLFGGGPTFVFAVLLAHAAVSLGLIGRAVLRSAER